MFTQDLLVSELKWLCSFAQCQASGRDRSEELKLPAVPPFTCQPDPLLVILKLPLARADWLNPCLLPLHQKKGLLKKDSHSCNCTNFFESHQFNLKARVMISP